jgi:predicted  nucleic acid-binding Zn-ribbon protein
MAWFRNFYRCARCGHEWTDEWSAMCEDDCPRCEARHMSPYKSEDLPSPRKARTPTPTTARTETQVALVIAYLKNARDNAKAAACPQTVKKIRSALKSAEGARRHMERRLANGQRP